MKLYRNLCEPVIESLDLIFAGNKYADKVVEKVLKQNSKWGSRDRRFIAETTYDIVRWYRLFQTIAECNEDDYWSLLNAWCCWKKIGTPDWPEFSNLTPNKFDERLQAIKERAVRESIPDWLDQLGMEELGDRWPIELAALNKEAKVVLRANTLKAPASELQKALFEHEQVETDLIPGYPDALLLRQRQNVFKLDPFKEGWFEVQDAASQLIAPFLKAEPGMRVIDACAGGGGKTLHLAALLQNKGRIIALDTEEWKLEELKKRARRASVGNIETKIIDSTKVIKRLENSADRLLLDVPCSGLGVLKRNPDAKWKLSLEFIEKVKALQHDILTDYSTMVKPGGILVYSTCSLLPSENEMQVKQFLTEQSGKFELLEEARVFPSEGFDGFYMARIRKLDAPKNS